MMDERWCLVFVGPLSGQCTIVGSDSDNEEWWHKWTWATEVEVREAIKARGLNYYEFPLKFI